MAPSHDPAPRFTPLTPSAGCKKRVPDFSAGEAGSAPNTTGNRRRFQWRRLGELDVHLARTLWVNGSMWIPRTRIVVIGYQQRFHGEPSAMCIWIAMNRVMTSPKEWEATAVTGSDPVTCAFPDTYTVGLMTSINHIYN